MILRHQSRLKAAPAGGSFRLMTIAALSSLAAFSLPKLPGCAHGTKQLDLRKVAAQPSMGDSYGLVIPACISDQHFSELQSFVSRLGELLQDGGRNRAEAQFWISSQPESLRERLSKIFADSLVALVPNTPQEHLIYQRNYWIAQALTSQIDNSLTVRAREFRHVFVRKLLGSLDELDGSKAAHLEIMSSYVNELYGMFSFVPQHERVALEFVIREVDGWLQKVAPEVITAYIEHQIAQHSRNNGRRREQERALLNTIASATPPRPLLSDTYQELRDLHACLKQSDRWASEESAWLYTHELPGGVNQKWALELYTGSNQNWITMRLEGAESCFFRMEAKTFLQALKSPSFGEHFDRAFMYDCLERDESIKKSLLAFDLPRPGILKYRRIFSSYFDSPSQHSLFPSMLLGRALAHRYPEIVIEPITIADNFKNEVIEPLNDDFTRGATVLMSFFCHGRPTELSFPYYVDNDCLPALLREHEGGQLFIHTIACFGAGFEASFKRAIEQNPLLAPRLSLVTESEAAAPNEIHFNGNVPLGSRYMLRIIQALLDPELNSFGECHDRADLLTQNDIGVQADARALIKGNFYP